MMEKEKEEAISLFGFIANAVVDGELPEDFTLPRLPADEGSLPWADGAEDGVYMYHVNSSEMPDDDRTLMENAVRAASEGDFEGADKLFCELGQRSRAICIINALQSYVTNHEDALSSQNIFRYSVHAMIESEDRECVKFGLSLMELYNTDAIEELKDAIRLIGLSDEFSIFSLFVMRQWEDGNQEIYQLARKIHGWGRIHAVEHMEPDTDEIKDWLLKEGVHNKIMPAYSAMVCWLKSDAASVLNNHPSREEFSGIRDIIGGLLDEGPVWGISLIENSDRMIADFLNLAKGMALELADYEAVRDICAYYSTYYGDGESQNDGIVFLCREILGSARCRNVVMEAVRRSVGLAQDLHIEYEDALPINAALP